MFYGDNGKPQTVGMFSERVEPGFMKTMQTLKESFESGLGSTSLNFLEDIKTILRHRALSEQYDEILFSDYTTSGLTEGASPIMESYHDANTRMLEQFKENSKGMLLEAAGYSSLNPVVGLTLPLLKRFWISNVYKDIVPTEVPTKPTFKVGIERSVIIDKDGKEHLLPDALYESPDTLIGSLEKGLIATTISVPQDDYNLVTESGGSAAQRDAVSTNFYISSVIIEVKAGTELSPDTEEVEITGLRIPVDMATGMFSYAVSKAGTGEFTTDITTDILMGSLDFGSGKFVVASVNGKITGVKVKGTLSNENNLTSASVSWKHEWKEFDIPDGIHLNTGLTVERMMRSKLLYNVDEAAYSVKMMAQVLSDIRDVRGFQYLDNSKTRLTNTKYLVATSFDCRPPSNYVGNPANWRKDELKETLDRVATKMKQVYKNKNLRFVVFGNPFDIRLLDGDVSWTYSSETPMGGIALDYKMGIINKMHNFTVVSSDRLTEGKIRIIMIPTSEEQITYKHFEFSLIIANDYRDPNQPNVPSVMSTLMSLDAEIMPIQGEISIVNNAVSSSEIYEDVTP